MNRKLLLVLAIYLISIVICLFLHLVLVVNDAYSQTTDVCEQCSAKYPVGASVNLTATPSEGAYFAGWLSNVCSGTGACKFTMPNAPVTVNAVFELKPILYLYAYGVSGGVITSSPSGINCSAVNNCKASFNPGASVTLTATAPAGKSIKWTGLSTCSTGTICKTTMSRSRVINIEFY